MKPPEALTKGKDIFQCSLCMQGSISLTKLMQHAVVTSLQRKFKENIWISVIFSVLIMHLVL